MMISKLSKLREKFFPSWQPYLATVCAFERCKTVMFKLQYIDVTNWFVTYIFPKLALHSSMRLIHLLWIENRLVHMNLRSHTLAIFCQRHPELAQ